MGKIDDMIQRLCPNGVEYKKLGEISEIYTGEQFNKTEMDVTGKYPVMNGGTSPSGYSSKYNEEGETISISQGGESAGYVQWNNTRFWLGAHCFAIHTTKNYLLNKFLYYFLKNSEYYIQSRKHGAGIPGLNRKEIQKLDVPVPPMEIQNEIVRILDDFTALTAELEAELEARRKQYEFYRNKLLDFGNLSDRGGQINDNQLFTWLSPNSKLSKLVMELCPNGVKLTKLGDICEIIAGGDKPKDNFSKIRTDKFKYPIYSNGAGENAILGYTDIPKIKERCITISARGTIGHCELRTYPFYPVIRLLVVIPQKELIADFLYHYINTIKFQTPPGGIPQLTVPELASKIIPLPPIELQYEIVRILNCLEKITNDISEGIPAEISARRKQYEYYRDKLLTFKRLEA